MDGVPQATGGAGTDTLTSIENLVGSAFDDNLSGLANPNITIPEGPIEFQESEFDVTLSWSEGNTRGVTAIPLSEFHRYLASRAIQVEGQPG